MKVILLEDVENLGPAGSELEVKDGYARNYLIPKKLAILSTKGNLKILAEERRRKILKEAKTLKDAQALAEELKKVSVTISRQVGEEDRIFGSVTTRDIAEGLANQGIKIDRKKIKLDEPIKALGIYDIPIKLHPQVQVEVKVWVVKEDII